jgi:hypothetical protein
MKTFLKTLGIIAIATIIGLSMMACGGGGDDDGPPPPPGAMPIALTVNEWKDGIITSASDKLEYTFTVLAGTRYLIWWSDRGEGDGTQTGDVKVSAWYSNGTPIFTNEDSAYSTGENFTPTSNGTVLIRVEPYNSAGVGTFAIVYSTGYSSRPNYFPASAVPLTANKWENGGITSSNSLAWYKFSVTAGTDYFVWWNDSYEGDSSKSLDVRVYGYLNNGTTPINGVDAGWTTSQKITPASNGIVYIRVSPYSVGNTGTFGIVYSTANVRPPIHSGVSAVPLTEKQWKNSELINANSEDWYSFSVSNTETYYIWWNVQASSYGDGTKTGDVKVSAYYSDGTAIFSNEGIAWGTPRNFTADSDDTIYVRVMPYSITSAGTYGIVYSTKNARPLNLPATITPLTADQWADGDIAADGADWYSFSVTSGTYRLWWNENGEYGNRTKSGDVRVSAWYSDGTAITNIDAVDYAWDSPRSFTATSADTVYVRVTPYYITSAGTYGIVYSTTNTRPTAPFVVNDATPLTVDTWKDGYLPTASSMDWYSISVTSGTYYLWWNDRESGGSDSGDGSKTGDVQVSVMTNDGTVLISERNTAWGTPASFTVSYTGLVYVRVIPWGNISAYIGTYGIVYSTTNTKPAIPFVAGDATSLIESVWENGNLPTADSMDWYSILVTSGTTYRLWTNQGGGSTYGDGTKTSTAKVTVMTNEGTILVDEENGAWNTAISFATTYSGIVYVRVIPLYSAGVGTYGIIFSGTDTTRPAVPFTVDATQLTESVWKDGNLPTINSMDWFSISVTDETTYRFWSNERGASGGNGTKTGDVKMTVLSNEGTILLTERDISWGTATAYLATYTGTVYVKVVPYSNSYLGTYGIAYSTGITRPAVTP